MLVVKEGLINSVRPEPVEGFFCKIKERFDGSTISCGHSSTRTDDRPELP
jgi:hypothetical protein